MSSGAYAAPLRLEPHTSRALAGILCALHLVACFSILMLSIEWLWRVALFALVLLSLFQGLRRHVLRHGRRAVQALLWDGAGAWQLTMGDGRCRSARLLPGAFVHPWLVVLNFSLEGTWRAHAVVLCADGLDSESHRRLRVRLRLENDPSSQAPL